MSGEPTIGYSIQTEAKILDIMMPGWVYEIDMNKLNMQFCNACVGGQLGWPEFINKSVRVTTRVAYCTVALNPTMINIATRIWKYEIENRMGDTLHV